MPKITSHTHRSKPKKQVEEPEEFYLGDIPLTPDDEEVLRRTVDGVDINYIEFDDLPDIDWPTTD